MTSREASSSLDRCIEVDATRYSVRFGFLLSSHWYGGVSADHWVQALFLTTVEMLRDLHVRVTGRSWINMSAVERRAVYGDVVRRIFRNRRPLDSFSMSIEEQAARVGETIEAILEFLMARDEEMPFEPICA